MLSAAPQLALPDLNMMEQDAEDGSSGEEEYAEGFQRIRIIKFTASAVAQAFSHYTYQTTGRKRLVCVPFHRSSYS